MTIPPNPPRVATDAHPNWSRPQSHGNLATLPPKRETLIGMAIRSWCERTNTSQTKLAERVDVESTYISRIVSGQRSPSRNVAMKIADELDIPRVDMALMLCEIDPAAFREGIELDVRRRVTDAFDAVLEGLR